MVAIVATVGVGGYFLTKKPATEPSPTPSPITSTATPEPAPQPEPQPEPVPPTTQTKFIFNTALSFGMQNNSDVRELQKRLALEGCYTGSITGNFDVATREAVKCFQRKYNFSSVPDSGFVGAYTRKVLNEGVAVAINPRPVLVQPTQPSAPLPPEPTSTPIFNPFALEDNSETHFRDIFGTNYNLVTDEDPSLYNKNHGIGQFKSDFSWKNNADLLAKVNEITSGLIDDKEKAEAIGQWVANSRSYAKPAVIISGDIYSIFKATHGICFDAAYLTVAMLRLADIPARPVSPMVFLSLTHEYTEFYYKGEWWGLDSTFANTPGGDQGRKAFKISTPVEVMDQIELPIAKQIVQKNPFADNEIFIYKVKKIVQPLTISKKDVPTKWGYLKVINPAMPLGIVYRTIYSWVEPVTQSCDYYACNQNQAGGVGFNINSGLEFSADRLTYRDGVLVETIPVFATVGSTTNAQVYKIPLPAGNYKYWFGSTSDKFVYEDIEIRPDLITLVSVGSLVNNKLSVTEFDRFKTNLSEQMSLFNY